MEVLKKSEVELQPDLTSRGLELAVVEKPRGREISTGFALLAHWMLLLRTGNLVCSPV